MSAYSPRLSTRQHYGLNQVALYGNLCAVPAVTARSLVTRGLVTLLDPAQQRGHAQLTDAGRAAHDLRKSA